MLFFDERQSQIAVEVLGRFNIGALDDKQRQRWCGRSGSGQRAQLTSSGLKILKYIPIPGDESIIGIKFVHAEAVPRRVSQDERAPPMANIEHRATGGKGRQLGLDAKDLSGERAL